MKKIGILVDHNSWIRVYAKILYFKIKNLKFDINFYNNQNKVKRGDILFILGCKGVVTSKTLSKNKYNLVVHESDLPKGKGMSPVSHQILANKKRIVCTMFCATTTLDSGPIVLRDKFFISKNDYYNDWRLKQGLTTVKMCLKFLSKKNIKFKQQKGRSTYFKPLNKDLFQIDINKAIKYQIAKLQASDFKKFYPFIKIKNKIFYLKK